MNRNQTDTAAQAAKDIRSLYLEHSPTKLEQLKALNRLSQRPGRTTAVIIGILSALVLGAGMSMVMEWENLFILGIAIGVVGIIGCLVTNPIYRSVTARKKALYAPQIIQLCNEIIAENESAS
jgi:tetrahydromethanopterin S-methyltransferase subunit G